MNYARRQQYRRLSHAGKAGLGSVVAGLIGLVVTSAGAAALGGVLLLAAVWLGFYVRHWLSLAGRSRVGAYSEDEVQRGAARAHVQTYIPYIRRGGVEHIVSVLAHRGANTTRSSTHSKASAPPRAPSRRNSARSPARSPTANTTLATPPPPHACESPPACSAADDRRARPLKLAGDRVDTRIVLRRSNGRCIFYATLRRGASQ